MRIGIELRQIVPQQSGGIVPLIESLLQELFSLDQDDEFFVYHIRTGYRLPASLPPHVQEIPLNPDTFWRELDYAAARDGLDVLVRSYPSAEIIAFPIQRQLFLIPDLQHEVMPEFFAPEVLAQRRAAFANAMGAGAIAVLSEHSRNTLLAHYPQASANVFLMSPALTVDTTTIDATLDEMEEQAIPPQPFFLYPANLWPHKNHQRLIAALAMLLQNHQPIALVLTGNPFGWEELQASYRDLPIYHLGFVSKQLLAELYRQAYALTFFSLYEGFGMPLLEAFQAGLPVICSNTTSLPEVGGDAILSCDPTDVSAIATLMARIVDDGDLRTRLVQRGRQRLSHYSWQRSAQNLLDTCRRLANAPSDHEAVLSAIGILSARFATSEADRAARLTLIEQLDTETRELRAHLATSEADRAARLTLIEQLDAEVRTLRERLTVSEADRAARLTLIEQLHEQLKTSEADRLARLELLKALQQQLQASEADRVARLDVIRAQQQLLEQPLISFLRRLRVM